MAMDDLAANSARSPSTYCKYEGVSALLTENGAE